MNEKRWQRARQLFDDAVGLDGAARRDFLARACGSDHELLEEVESLFSYDRPSDSTIGNAVREAKLDAGGMTLRVGEQLGPYEITSVIDAGGMGEVYRARDHALEREVAIKVMPDAFASDPDRLLRFEREAKALASLNHPNVASIYGLVETAEGHALVLELVAGETLSERLERGPIAIDQALMLAKQIAEALDVAHEHGTIHCDLKPANIKITPESVIKVLDFGLAKSEQSKSGSRSSRLSETRTRRRVLSGTAAYMSPEQAGGEPLDRRTDVWAFGVVFYEMLTGRSLFARDTVSETLAAVVSETIVFDDLPSETPAEVVRLLERCLQRDRRSRLRDIGDAHLDLADAIRARSNEPTGEDQQQARRRRPVLMVVAAAGGLMAIAGWLAVGTTFDAALPVNRFELIPPDGVVIASSSVYHPGSSVAASPTGRAIAFAGSRDGRSQIYVRSMDELEARPLEGSNGGHTPFFSPDGRWVGFLAGSSASGGEALKKVPAVGGTPVTIATGHFEGAAWGPDDTIVVGSQDGLQRTAASGGTPTPLMALTEPETHRAPHFLPNGRAVVFYVWTGSPDTYRVEALSLATGERRTLVNGSSPRVLPSHDLVFARDGALWAVDFDPIEMTVRGDPVRVVEELDENVGGFASYDVTKDGALLYVPAISRAHTLVWVDLDGRETPLDMRVRRYGFPRVSPDGTRIAFSTGISNVDIWFLELERSILSRFTVHPAADSDAEWSPDGRRIVFHSHRNEGGNLYWRSADGTGEIHQLTTGSGEKLASTWTRDGRSVLYWARHPDTGMDIYRAELDGSSPPTAILSSPASEATGTLSPDGRWLAYTSDESGEPEIYVRPFPDVSSGKWQVSFGRGWAPVWSPDGRAIYYRQGAEMRRVFVNTDSGLVVGKPETLFEGSYVAVRWWDRVYDIAPDGKRFVMLKNAPPESTDESRPRLVLVQHWADEVSELVRTPR